mgnify:CR=1 FL=1
MLTGISSKLWREAGFAKNSLDSLPVEYLELQNTNKLQLLFPQKNVEFLIKVVYNKKT